MEFKEQQYNFLHSKKLSTDIAKLLFLTAIGERKLSDELIGDIQKEYLNCNLGINYPSVELRSIPPVARYSASKIKIEECLNYCTSIVVKDSYQNIRLPFSARPFLLNHKVLGKTREIADFPTLLRRKIYMSEDFDHIVGILQNNGKNTYSKALINRAMKYVDNLEDLYVDCLSIYKDVSEIDVDMYKRAIKKLKKLPDLQARNTTNKRSLFSNITSKATKEQNSCKTPEVYHGRDARGLYLARKAEQFGLPPENKTKIVYVVTSRELLFSSYMLDYLRQQGVVYDAYHIDTGYTGSIPEQILKFIANSKGIPFSARDLNSRIKLLASEDRARQSLIEKRGRYDSVAMIECRADFCTYPRKFIVRNNRIIPDLKFESSKNAIRAWVVEQAIIREFVPKVSL